jgi:hypothetical protein
MYDRPSQVATKFNTWYMNKDMSTGVVGIPILMNRNDPHITPQIQSLVEQAAAIISQTTCVKFSPMDQISPLDRYVNVTVDLDSNGNPSGCMAMPPGLAELPSTPTSLSVGGCLGNAKPLGSLVHELLHVLSLVHTQMRTDRDDYIRMNPEIVRHFFEENFFLTPYSFDGADGNYSPYDYGSIMHYTRTQAADPIAYRARPELGGTFSVLKTLSNGITLGQRNAMSALDMSEVNTIYTCNGVIAGDPKTFKTASQLPTIGTLAPRPTVDVTPILSTPSPTTPTQPPVGTSIAPSTTQSPPDSKLSGWQDDIKLIADSIDRILGNQNIYLNDKQLDLLQDMLKNQRLLFDVFSAAESTLRLGWRDLIVQFATNVYKLIGISRKGISDFDSGKNSDQEGILDFGAINDLEKIITATKKLYAKLDSFSKTIPGAIT